MTDEEKRFMESYSEYCCDGKPLSPYYDLWEAGVEFGNDKANEMHKYSERPKKKINALCFNISQNKFILGFYDPEDDEWLRYGGYETIHIDLWKEIVLPELPKENE